MTEFPNVLDSKVEANPLIAEFTDEEVGEEYRYAYAEEHLNTWIALQIKTLRDQRGLTQAELAEMIGTQQPAIARLENASYFKWKTETLRKIARALGVRLKITFETFGTLLDEDADITRKTLERPAFKDDPVFSYQKGTELAAVSPIELMRAALAAISPTPTTMVADSPLLAASTSNAVPRIQRKPNVKKIRSRRRSHGRRKVA